MLSHRVLRLFPRLALLTVLLGLLPPAALPAVLTTPHVNAAPMAAAPAAVLSLPAESNPVPQPNVTPASKAATAPIGQVSATAVQSAILLPTWGATPSGVWYYTGSAGWQLKHTGLPTGWRWAGIAVDRFDPRIWYLWGNATGQYGIANGIVAGDSSQSALWRSTDTGEHWLPVSLSTSSVRVDSPLFVVPSDTTRGLFFAGMLIDASSFAEQVHFWRGSTTQPALAVVTAPDGWEDLWGMTTGTDGEAVLDATTGRSANAFGYIQNGATTWTIVTNAGGLGGYEKLPGASRAVLARSGANLYATSDYRASLPSVRLTNMGTSATAALDGVYVGGRTGIMHVTNLLTTPASSLVAGTQSVTFGSIRADRQTRSVVAALRSDRQAIYVRPGLNANWQTLTITQTQLSDQLEVIGGQQPLDLRTNRSGGEVGVCACYHTGRPSTRAAGPTGPVSPTWRSPRLARS